VDDMTANQSEKNARTSLRVLSRYRLSYELIKWPRYGSSEGETDRIDETTSTVVHFQKYKVWSFGRE
jgi:hypothetical protein